MGLITKEVEVILHPTIIEYYEGKGYKIVRRNDKRGRLKVIRGSKILVKVDDLSKGSHVKVDAECDNCGKIKDIPWKDFNKISKEDGNYYCQNCALKLYGTENRRKSRLNNSISFEQWCIENERQDLLDRWDYDLNEYSPNEISYGSNIKQWLKCPKGIHNSELKKLTNLVFGQEGSIQCNKCNSLGYKYPNVFNFWSDKNEKTPYDYSFCSGKRVWWKCPNGKHNDFKRIISGSTILDFHCPECNYSKGEERINEKLIAESFTKILEDEYNEIIILDNQVYYIPQKTFEGLVGLGNGLLSYDFYILKYN